MRRCRLQYTIILHSLTRRVDKAQRWLRREGKEAPRPRSAGHEAARSVLSHRRARDTEDAPSMPRTYYNSELRPDSPILAYHVSSASQPGVAYLVTYTPDRGLGCDCPDYH